METSQNLAKPWNLVERTQQFAVAVEQFCDPLRNPAKTAEAARQLTRAASSVAANYRASRRGRSTGEFISKLGTVVEEADEAEFWLGYLIDIRAVDEDRAAPLRAEANELVSIFTASLLTAKTNLEKKKRERAKKRSKS